MDIDMKKRVHLELKDRSPAEVRELRRPIKRLLLSSPFFARNASLGMWQHGVRVVVVDSDVDVCILSLRRIAAIVSASRSRLPLLVT